MTYDTFQLTKDNSANDTTSSYSKLCSKCSVLSFNDAELGGYKEDGVLQFNDEESEQMKTLKLNYKHVDALPDLPLLRESAEAGCHFCATLRRETLSLGIDHGGDITYRLRYTFGPKLTERYEEYVGVYLLIVEMTLDKEGLEVLQERLAFTVDSTGVCRDWLQTLPSPNESVLSAENITSLRNVLSECEADCECSEAEVSDHLPTRLLDLRDWDSSQRIRLVEASSIGTPGDTRYVALSYCWGPAPAAALQLKTTHDTYKHRVAGIDAESLTPVMRDSVILTRAMSFRYIWIDALCIIQGDYEDWVRESSQMDHVYANAYFVLCPLTSTTCLEGFLQREKAIKVPFKSSIESETDGLLHLRFLKSGLRGNTFSVNYMETSSSVWNTRGWTFQEKNLATRRIYVGRSQLHYVCAGKEWMEPSWWSSSPEDHQIQQYLLDDSLHGDPNDNWTEIVEEYVSRQLTSPADRFPALSGIAKLFAKATEDNYVAGLWLSDILRQCLWEGYSGVNSLDGLVGSLAVASIDEYICPSWSWARQYDVSFPRFHPTHVFRSECGTLDAWALPMDPDLDLWGRVRDGHLKVEARYMTISGAWTRTTDRESTSRFHRWNLRLSDGRRIDCSLDWNDPNADLVPFTDVTLVLLASSINTGQTAAYDITREGEHDEVSDNRMSEEDWHVGDDLAKVEQREYQGLLLHPLPGDQMVRIGTFVTEVVSSPLNPFRTSPLKIFDIV